jgi:hypothetical protein
VSDLALHIVEIPVPTQASVVLPSHPLCQGHVWSEESGDLIAFTFLDE